ncbi:tumor necrosis factor receptor superfamily member 14-like isoform X2 [Dreissena polymorpha]|uniref:tumor necrosis factor receptor superfamily member 14-like isoform X2 n=1 Tax=Dreissena polymorpha TaxID=45954 RepID=UPI002263EFEE|nr:tumor necrosis factor receptor superfamily member 14-like isoform X2 [Dreissena polymorpha]
MFRLFTAIVLIYSVRCDERIYYEHNNMTCVMCPPGSHWVGHCLTNGASADCVPCPHDQYNPAFNRAIYCKQCRTSCWNQNHEHESVQREEIVQACTGISDLKCQCKEGYWREKGTNNICQRVLTCGQGQGVKTKATPNSDTVCEDCIHGETFSNLSSTTEKCLPCSSCVADEILHRSCTATEGTICAVRTTTGRKELVMGLGIGLSFLALAFLAIGVGLYVFCYCRSAKTDSDSITQDNLQFNVSTHEVVNRTRIRAHGTTFQGQRPQANEISTHVFIDETKANDTASRKQSVKAIVRNACNRGNASGSASEENGACVNDIVSHTDSAQDNENNTEAAIVVNGPKYIDNAYKGEGKAASVIPDGKRASAKL